MGYFYSPQLAAAVGTELSRQRYDLICVHCSSVAPYVASVPGVPKLLDFGDMDSQKWLAYAARRRFPLSLVYELEGRKLRRSEVGLAQRFDFCSCTTRDELDTLRSYGTATPSGWFPNGVDTQYFTPTDEPYDGNTMCFLGRMDYYPNQESMVRFCADTLPRLRQRRPGITLLIIGANPSRAVRRLAAEPGVVITGSVADVRPYGRRAALSIAPLHIARGTQNKILESLAMGIPVVCSPIAARGVDAVPGEHLLTAGDTGTYVDTILRLLEHPAERQRLADAGRARMLSHHNWERSMHRLDRLIEECLAAAAHPRTPRTPV
jgi:polysaccharide biosynthesis protein PslH